MIKKIIVILICLALIPIIMPSGTGQIQEYIGPTDWFPEKNGENTYDITTETICINSMKPGGAWAWIPREVYHADLNYTVEFDFKLLEQDTHWFVLYSDGFLFLVVDWGTDLKNYPSNTLAFNLEINRWYTIRMEAYPTKGTYDIYIDGIKQGTATGVTHSNVDYYHTSSPYINDPSTIFIGDPDDTSYRGGAYNRGSGCWKTVSITYGTGNIPDLVAVITTPTNNSIYLEDDTISFAGSVSGGTQPYSYTWISNKDGQISTGTGFSFWSLTPGTHLITLTVTDAGSQTATDQITLTITPASTGTIIQIEDRTIASGTESQTKIRCSNAQNIGDFGIDITYNPSVIEILNVYKGSLQNIASTTQDWNILSPGTLRIGIITSQGINGDGSIAEIRFKAIGSSGEYTTLTLDADAHDANTFQKKTLTLINGQITISSQIPIGDGNGDGKVTWLDALLALRMYVGKEPVNLILDVNHDGDVTPLDATMILKASLGKIILS